MLPLSWALEATVWDTMQRWARQSLGAQAKGGLDVRAGAMHLPSTHRTNPPEDRGVTEHC